MARSENTSAAGSASVDKASRVGFLLHGGLPLALATGQHYTFQVVPELNFGYATSTTKATAAGGADITNSGFRFDIGARVGTEVHFGFVGIPELALQATIGLQFKTTSGSTSSGPNSTSDRNSGFGTTVQADPWALFANNISALYYF